MPAIIATLPINCCIERCSPQKRVPRHTPTTGSKYWLMTPKRGRRLRQYEKEKYAIGVVKPRAPTASPDGEVKLSCAGEAFNQIPRTASQDMSWVTAVV